MYFWGVLGDICFDLEHAYSISSHKIQKSNALVDFEHLLNIEPLLHNYLRVDWMWLGLPYPAHALNKWLASLYLHVGLVVTIFGYINSSSTYSTPPSRLFGRKVNTNLRRCWESSWFWNWPFKRVFQVLVSDIKVEARKLRLCVSIGVASMSWQIFIILQIQPILLV